MNKHILVSVALFLALGLVVRSQTRYDKVTDMNFWNDGRNMAGMRIGSLLRSSYAEASGGFSSGDFKAPWEASSSWNAGAAAGTRNDLEKFSMAGSFSFSQKQGSGMDESMFIHPGFYPVDVMEFTPGRKTLQAYSFMGGIAVPLGRWTVGGRMDFESDNYSKRKDIRHTNYRLDMTVAPSVAWRARGWTFGTSYVFRKTSESIQAEQVGTATADSYYAFLDKGLGFGSYQVWNGSGIHLAEAGIDRFAVKEYSSGAALQVSRTFRRSWMYADAEYLATYGEVGEKSYTFYKFPGASFTARVGYSTAGNLLRLRYSWKTQSNDEYVIDKVSQGGVVNPVTYGRNRIFDRREMSLVPEWTYYGDWLYKAHVEACWTRKEQLSQLQYPYSFEYSTDILSVAFSTVLRLGRWRPGLQAGFLKGFWDESAAGVSADERPSRQEDVWGARVEWDNAARISAGVSLRWDVPLARLSGMYLEAAGSMLHGSGLEYLGGTSYGGIFKVGYEF